MNPIQQLEQSLTTLNTPAVVQGFRTNPMAPTPVQIPVASPSYVPTTTVTPTGGISPPMILIGIFGVSLLTTIAGSGTVRTLGVVGMLGSVGLFLAGVSQIH